MRRGKLLNATLFWHILVVKIRPFKGTLGVKCKRELSTCMLVRISGCCWHGFFFHWFDQVSVINDVITCSSTLSCLFYSLASLLRQSSELGNMETHFSVALCCLDCSTSPRITQQVWAPNRGMEQQANTRFLIYC